MQIEVANRIHPNSMVTMQLLRMLCPKCKQPVEYILSDEDRQFEADANYWKMRAEQHFKRIENLERHIKHLEELLETR